MSQFVRGIALLLLVIGTTSAQAHFLFLRLQPPAEGGRHVDAYFSDHADTGDPQFVDKIANTKLWRQTKSGTFEPLTVRKAPDRLRALVPFGGAFSVIGECTYGVLARPKQTAFLLRYYPKAVTGKAEEIATLKPKPEIPLEIEVRTKGEELEFVALRNGKPIANAQFIAIGDDLKDHKFTANAEGKGFWKPTATGHFAVYTSQTLKEAGVFQETKYEEIREFATLSFAWPMGPTGADAEAVKLFQEATAARAAWHDFPGFSAEVKAVADGRSWKGTATITAKGDVKLAKADAVVAPWVRDQLESMVLHRLAQPQGKPPIVRFADNDLEHPLGRLVIFDGGKMASSYRVKDRQLMTVNRSLGKLHMTITVLENDLNAEKAFLPRTYSIRYWDAVSGNLQRDETVQTRWTRLGTLDLPTQLTVVSASAAGQGVKTMSLSQHRLLNVK
jgi:Protein of unknown function (DUF3386)